MLGRLAAADEWIMGAQIIDQGHRLIIRVGPRAALRAIFAYALFLTGLIFAGWWGLSGREPDFSGPSFWVPWLAVLTWIGGYFLFFLVWGLFGRVLLIVTSESLEVRKELWRFARTKTYQAGLVRDVHPKLVPCSDDDLPRTDFGLRVLYEFDNFHVGEGMSQYEAQHVASTVLSRIRPPASWGGAERAPAQIDHVPNPQLGGGGASSRTVVILVILMVGLFAVTTLGPRLVDDEQPPQLPKRPLR